MIRQALLMSYAIVAYLVGTAGLLALIVFLSGWGFAFAAAMTAFTLVGCWFVERTCLRLYGPAYREFQSTTPLLLPRLSMLWHRRRLSRGLVR